MAAALWPDSGRTRSAVRGDANRRARTHSNSLDGLQPLRAVGPDIARLWLTSPSLSHTAATMEAFRTHHHEETRRPATSGAVSAEDRYRAGVRSALSGAVDADSDAAMDGLGCDASIGCMTDAIRGLLDVPGCPTTSPPSKERTMPTTASKPTVEITGITDAGAGRIVCSLLSGHKFVVELPIKKTMQETLAAIESTMSEFHTQSGPPEARPSRVSEPVWIPDLSGDDQGGRITVEAHQSAFPPVKGGPQLRLNWALALGRAATHWIIDLPFEDWERILEDAKRKLRKATGDAW